MKISDIRKIIVQLQKENTNPNISEDIKKINTDLINFYNKKIWEVTRKVFNDVLSWKVKI